MLPDQQFLRIPGPTPIPPSVERAMSRPMIGHRNPETAELLEKIKPGLRAIFGTKQDVLILAGSGTAGLEAAVTNAVKPNEEALVIVTGAFGDRFHKICQAHEIKAHRLDIDWGEAASPDQVKTYLEKHPQIKAVFMTYCETSTGVLNPIAHIAEVVKQYSDALTIVDGVSCVGAVETKMDEWGIDLFITGSQKALMLPPGLTFLVASDRAWKVMSENERPRFYFDLQTYRDKLAQNSTPYTPALSLLFGLEQVLNLMNEEGLDEVYKRHLLMKNMTRHAFKALDLPLLTSDKDASPTVTAVKPVDFSADDLRQIAKKEFGMSLAGGQQHLKGKIFRVGHMGYSSPADVLQYISIIELALTKVGKSIELGKGVQAAQEVYLKQ
ncbi:aspartate aminotransferase-like enzyme [Cerasibacillus quisquiliarum]|uniref:Class V aminotransferase n=1 Tax=Cerasibacillus quisquiliarum TaxID=227865 RepID=A0A511UVY8_9BACI|nr:alanine--glyoxylate aminotransferase family protein [Cerasibacillus quisquiliarum]MBB5146453.1 aspartate aminotransferase-like enzyme [Cerasibacillus quisquiliarum]GEN30779.1 class V aminotransferase [Cerasibacillus quisquiliarum]